MILQIQHVPYMYHCHNLFHEDAGMMGQFIVIDTITTLINEFITENDKYKVYPNPAHNVITVERKNNVLKKTTTVKLFDLTGREAMTYHEKIRGTSFNIDVSDLVPGNYLIFIMDAEENTEVLKLIKQ